MNKSVEELKRMTYDFDEWVGEIAEPLFEDERFHNWPASINGKHHYWSGGLAEHTLEVVKLCFSCFEITNNKSYSNIPYKEMLFLAALFHDSGKMYDYKEFWIEKYSEKPIKAWDYNKTHKSQIHHITRSALIWNEYANGVLSNSLHEIKLIDEVTHAILAHHGRKEWGSPVTPKTRLAYILHHCDSISARCEDCERITRDG